MTFDSVKFGERLQKARLLRGMKQEQLAEKLNISLNFMKRLESGSRSCSLDILIEISLILNVSTDYLLLGESSIRSEERKEIQSVINELSDFALKL